MKKYIILYFIFILTSLSSCVKDETLATAYDNPVAPELTAPSPTIKLQRANSSDSLHFTGTNVDFGFPAADTYILEMDVQNNNFQSPVKVETTIGKNNFTIAVKDFNQILLGNGVPEYTDTAVKMRVKVTVHDNFPVVYSNIVDLTVSAFGPPKLIIITNPATDFKQNILSPGGDGIYSGLAKLQAGTFILTDQETNTVYGGENGVLIAGGSPEIIPYLNSVEATWTGWYRVEANTNNMTYEVKQNFVGIVGKALPNGNKPPTPPNGEGDNKMDYDSNNDCWEITVYMKAGWFKFRMNDDWGVGVNVGNQPGTPSGQNDLENLANASNSANITFPIDETTPEGTYTVRLYLNANPIRCTFTPAP
ncbi:MAG: SusE domain-containing protein [Prolixibacteraceae bacterium]|jgi:hypothetical protein